MALQVLFAHTGQRLLVDPGIFTSIDAYKTWLLKHGKIPIQEQISLTTIGKQIRFQGLVTEKEVFVYDRRIIQSSSPSAAKSLLSEIPLPAKFNITRPPDTITDQNDLQAWKDLFMARRSWALNVADNCVAMSDQATDRYLEAEVIARGIDTAVLNFEKHVKTLDQKFSELQSWTAGIQKEHDLVSTDWEASMTRLRALPATNEMIRFITGQEPRQQRSSPTLEDMVDIEDVRRAGKIFTTVSKQLSRNSADLGSVVDDILKRSDNLFEKVETSPARSVFVKKDEPKQLLEDIEAIAKKISNDYENVLGYPSTPKNISQASKSALLHTKNFLPNMSTRGLEMDGILRAATETRNRIAGDSIEIMHDIAVLTSMVSEANARFASMSLDQDAFDAFHMISMVNTLPVTYASFMAEAVRRREWNEKVKADSSTLANEMAAFQDEEAKRRRKWQKNVGVALWGEKAERKVIGLEVNLLGDDEEWPPVTRRDLEVLLGILESQDKDSRTTAEVSKIIADLKNPTKQQSRRAKAFKNGSIHEAALGRSTLLMRGDDDLLRVLQEEKQKTESKLRTAESRIRRLEDLLHRQSAISRASTGNVFQVSGLPSPDPQQHTANPMASPRLQEDLSRRSSVSSRRFSANQGADEKAFQQKLLSLEAELIAEREKASGLEKEADARKGQLDEANSNKKDLMDNLQAQKIEFAVERQALQAEVDRLKQKLEELEDELDRYLGSRDIEKASVDDRVHTLLEEVEKVKKEAVAEAQKAQGQVEFLRNDAKLQRETNDLLQLQLQKIREENRDLLARAMEAESLAENQGQTLFEIHSHLAPTSPVPEESRSLATKLLTLSGDLVSKLKSVKSDAALAAADRDVVQAALTAITAEKQSLKEKLVAEERESFRLRDILAEERAKTAAIETELTDERLQLSTLRTKITDGETGSETLRSRLEEEERKVTSMSADLAMRQSRIGGLEEELRAYQDKHESVQAKHDKLFSRFDSRTSRAKDLTQRLYAQNDRLCKLLERLSYSITREGDSMIIQKVPKPERTSANDSSDPSTSLRRSISGALTHKAMVDSGDLDLLYWMHNDDSETESEKYEAYLNAVGSFDIEAFCEVIAKRVRDMEHTAKKYSRDARSYRDKSHSAQKEAHEKIAFKNFKEGDLALFLPTRNQAAGAWAAFNVGYPHYFLREQESHKLRSRDWLLARIHKIEDRVVDLSKSISAPPGNDGRSFGETSNGSLEDDNPFDLSDGLRWYLIDASEEKPGAPTTPGLGKSTVASTNVDATGSIRRGKKSISSAEAINKSLSKSLDSRRGSTNSKKSFPIASGLRESATPPHTADNASIKTAATTATVAPNGEPSGTNGNGSANTNGATSPLKVQTPNNELPPFSPSGTTFPNQNPTQALTNILSAATTSSTARPQHSTARESRDTSGATSPVQRRSVIWDSLWSLDFSVESGKRKK